MYRLAHQHKLSGWVSNTGSGVEIEIGGLEEDAAAFISSLQHPPPLAVIDELIKDRVDTCSFTESRFIIRKSAASGKDPGSLPPDADICPTCLSELFHPADPRFLYPFINCTDCGPRYTVIENIPYDRSFTTMKDFLLCPDCEKEYQDPFNRRFHAQTNCCPSCGPHYILTDRKGNVVAGIESDFAAINETAGLLKTGNIVAIKGIGGFHLVADACNEQVVQALRLRKRRPEKPLAVMVSCLEKAMEIAEIGSQAQELICSAKKPIVILRKKKPFFLAENVVPNTVFIGIMLPYSPLHYLLFNNQPCDFLVMTSGNVAGSPIIRDTLEAYAKLDGIADYFLVHDRQILISNDDSVVRCEKGRTTLLRRSRSYAPAAIQLHQDVGRTLAFGAMLKNTICLTRGRSAFFSHHIGELEHPDTAAYLTYSRDHFLKSLRIEPDLLVCDLHPEYPSTILAKEYSYAKGIPLVQVQHHHAHAVSCMAEHGLAGPVLAVILDGSGWGDDATVWGGEIFTAEYDCFVREAHLMAVPMPGGDAAVLQPWRMAVSYLHEAYQDVLDWDRIVFLDKYRQKIPLLLQMIDKNINSPLTSSCGRLFDALAALLGICTEASFEGQAASCIEMLAAPHEKSVYPIDAEKVGSMVFDTALLVRAVIQDQQEGISKETIAARFQNSLALFFANSCEKIRQRNGINQVVLSGGVFQNVMFTNILQERLDMLNFSVYTQNKVVPGDGGIALGQAVAGRAIYLKSRN